MYKRKAPLTFLNDTSHHILNMGCDRGLENSTLRAVRIRSCCHFPTPLKGTRTRLPGVTVWHADILLLVMNGSLCGTKIPPGPLMSLRKAWVQRFMTLCLSTGQACLGYLSVNVVACWRQQQMQGPLGVTASSDKQSLSSAPVQERAAAKYQALSSAQARWWDESCCSQ